MSEDQMHKLLETGAIGLALLLLLLPFILLGKAWSYLAGD